MRQTYVGKHYPRFKKKGGTGEEIIRIPLSCRRAMSNGSLLDHFNLIDTGNIVGKRYLLCCMNFSEAEILNMDLAYTRFRLIYG